MTAPVEVPDRLLTVQESAARLALTPWSVYQMIGAGVLPVHRTGLRGRTLRIAEADLVAYLRRVRSAAPSTDSSLSTLPSAS